MLFLLNFIIRSNSCRRYTRLTKEIYIFGKNNNDNIVHCCCVITIRIIRVPFPEKRERKIFLSRS